MCITCHPLIDDVGPNVQIFQFGVALVLGEHENVLFDEIFFFFFFRLSGLELFLYFFDESKGVVQVGRRRCSFAGFFGIGSSIRPVKFIRILRFMFHHF